MTVYIMYLSNYVGKYIYINSAEGNKGMCLNKNARSANYIPRGGLQM
jgi:hypothetical protein